MNVGNWSLETITPEQAATYLKAMSRNRPPKVKRVSRYATEMKKGRWRLTHQGIAFNCDGSLKDGQHRLLAVVEAKTPVMMWVYRGLENAAMRIIDTHGPRSDQNALYIDGLDVDIKDTATAKAMFSGMRSKSTIERDDLHEFVIRHKDALAFVGERLKTTERGAGHSCVAAVVARAYYSQDHHRLNEFCEVMRDGVTDNRENFAALRLRNWLQSSLHGAGASQVRACIYKKTEAALKAFIERRDIAKIYEASVELFPLPEEAD